jgi:RNA polymerase sigma factor (TIGR02999 family)
MNEITKLLKAWKSGDKEALDQLMTLIVPELKQIAHNYMSGEKPGNILQTTALVNEALIKLIPEKISFEDRKQFYRVVAKRMRQVLTDEAKKQLTAKRGKRAVEQLDDRMVKKISSARSRELLRLDAVLEELANEDEQKAAIVECHFFTGLSFAEVAQLLGLSKTKVEREWNRTRLQLKREMTKEP